MKQKIKTLQKKLQDEFSIDPELEFLPAALEIQQTPPLPTSRIILWLIVLFFIIAVLWASFGHVDIVAVAQGKIIPSGKIKTIQPLQPSTVKHIHVKEGQRVKQGQLLLELDNTASRADQASLENERETSQRDIIRLNTLLDALQNTDTQPDNDILTIKPCEASETCLQTALSDIDKNKLTYRTQTQWRQYQAQLASLQNQIEEKQAEQQATQEQISQLTQTIPLITERANAIKSMLQEEIVSRTEWLSIEEERIQQVKQKDIQKNNRNKIQSAINSLQKQQQAFQAETESRWLVEKNEATKKHLNIQQELIKNTQLNKLQQITSPVDGTVLQLATHTIGGVVTEAQELMKIVPQDEALQVEAMVLNKDIGFVEAGQEAKLKIDTFPFTKYGYIDGTIDTLSNDAVENEKLGLVYAAQLGMNKTTMLVNGKTVNLSPGMSVTVEVNLGKRRIIEYILTPLLKYKSESIRER